MADVAATVAALGVLAGALDDATREAVADVARMVQAAGRANAPVGVPEDSTDTRGDLRRSIIVDGPDGGDGTWEAQVGPTVVYARQRELGGAIYPHKPHTRLRFKKFGTVYYPLRVYQHPEPYMLPADLEVREQARDVFVARLAEAIETG